MKNVLEFYREIGAGFIENSVSEEPAGMTLEGIRRDIESCTRCALHQNKTRYVPGEGSATPDVVFVGEGPGETEDRFGKPFIGKAGQLLEKIIMKMGYTRETVFICNIVKCRPPGNRDPQTEEVEACLPYLTEQLKILRPKVIVCLGRVAINNLMGQKLSITKVRGQLFEYCGIPVIPTYHPSYILRQRNQEELSRTKWEVWRDMEKVLQIVGKPVS